MCLTRVAVQGFGTTTETFNTSIHEIKVVDAHGSHHSISAIKRSDLNLSIPLVSTKVTVVQRWRERGIEVSDANTTDSSEIWLLIGACLRPSGGDIPVPVRSPKSSTVERG